MGMSPETPPARLKNPSSDASTARIRGKTLQNSSNNNRQRPGTNSPCPWKRFCLAMVLSVVLFSFANAQADTQTPDLETVLTGIEHRYSGQDFTANFYQTSRLAAIEITETANGQAFFSHPGRMRWEYQEPERQEIITNGKTLWIYRTEENQVVKGDAAAFFKTGGGGAFLSDITLIRIDYTITLGKFDTDFVTLVLVPKRQNPEITTIDIRVSRTTFDVDRVETTNTYGDTTILEFKEITFHKLEKALFEFTVPEGTDLLFMNPNEG
ncbi:outer membrane lipoprotein carrier protein precursor [Desulforapulum autotrophicum HRM2]|uniref:Outer membrane lipoprotein carrier protein n=1 Tax=Desulforapulum autotrophicum (strain ATCC 43914 / DSM 3382 / VKM B-1955 / HRM2) TaxID=177437 RepID=C0QGP4_DESAH|nr:outer membrane lipoprotein carrier protein precursor [Desulforapulum autotrophicum HRM2]